MDDGSFASRVKNAMKAVPMKAMKAVPMKAGAKKVMKAVPMKKAAPKKVMKARGGR